MTSAGAAGWVPARRSTRTRSWPEASRTRRRPLAALSIALRRDPGSGSFRSALETKTIEGASAALAGAPARAVARRTRAADRRTGRGMDRQIIGPHLTGRDPG